MARSPQGPDNLVLVQLREMRRENEVVREQQLRLIELIGRLSTDIAGVRSDIAAIRADLGHLKSDVVLLENQNISRHGELLSILKRLHAVETAVRG